MKKFTLLTVLFTLLSVTAFAQKKAFTLRPIAPVRSAVQITPTERTAAVGHVARRAGGELVTPPSTATVETWYTTSGKFNASFSSGWEEITADMSTINVAIDGSDIYIQGLAYWFKEAWIKGSISGTTATFDNGQFIGEDSYGSEFIIGSDDGSTIAESGIVFNYDATEGILSAATSYIFESGKADDLAIYCYWYQPVFSKTAPAAPEVVVAPDGLVVEEYAMAYTPYGEEEATGSASINVGFDGNDVYFQGINSYLPEAWIKGTLDGTTVTFAGGQYFGKYNSYEMFFQDADAVFTYDATAGTFSTEGIVYTYAGSKYVDYYIAPVLKKVIEKAATPATPTISDVSEGKYGWSMMFNVPIVDTNGEGMVTSKLSYQVFTDIEQDVAPLTFTSATHSKLTEDMTVIPYGFTEDYDFYDNQIYFNDLFSEKWNKIGIQSIYTGGGEENKSEIFWFTIKEYGSVTFDFNAMDVAVSTGNTDETGNITEDKTMTAGDVTLTISPQAEGASSPNRFWKTNDGPQLRVYSGTLTFEVPATRVITKITFKTGSKWAANSADCGTLQGKEWTGSSNKVVIIIGGNTQINSIDVETAEFVPTPVEAPEDLKTETYKFTATALENGKTETVDYSLQVLVGFDGNDAYIQGLAGDCPELWVKATKNAAGKYVIPANQYMGTYDVGGLGWFIYDYFFTAVDAEDNLTDVVLDYDAEKGIFSTAQTLVLNGDVAELYPYMTFSDVTITKMVEVAATPADPSIDGFNPTGYIPNVQFTIPTKGTNDEDLLASKLFYTIWIEKDGTEQTLTLQATDYDVLDEDMTEIPYTFGDNYDIFAGGSRVYLNMGTEEIATWAKIGVQSIYYGGGECHKSNVVWLENGAYTGISATLNDKGQMTNPHVYDLQGRKVANPTKGLYIVNGKLVVVK